MRPAVTEAPVDAAGGAAAVAAPAVRVAVTTAPTLAAGGTATETTEGVKVAVAGVPVLAAGGALTETAPAVRAAVLDVFSFTLLIPFLSQLFGVPVPGSRIVEIQQRLIGAVVSSGAGDPMVALREQ